MDIDYLNIDKMTSSMLQGVDACMEKEAFTSAATLILTYIDALSGFFTGQNTSQNTFGRFIDRYMSLLPWMSTELGKTKDEAIAFLYDKYRCGFVHEFLSKAGTGITRERPYVSLEKGIVVIDINKFRDDFAQALQGFKQDVQNNTEGIGNHYRLRVNYLRSRPAELFIKLVDTISVTDVTQQSISRGTHI